MAIRSTEFVGIAEGIKSHELSTKGRIESLRGAISELSGAKRSLESQISYLEATLAAAYEDTDEDGELDYGRISAIEAQISQAESQLSEVEGELVDTHNELSKSEAELDGVMEEKARTLFEIQERARKTSNNIAVAGGMYGAYSGVGSSLQSSMQTSLASLSQAANILDGSVDGFTGGGSGGDGGGGSTGGRGMTSQEDLSTCALSAFAVGTAASSVLSGNTSPASTPSSFTTNHTNGTTPATTFGSRLNQKTINAQKTLNFASNQDSNRYSLLAFVGNGEYSAFAEKSMFNSCQQSTQMEAMFINKDMSVGIMSSVLDGKDKKNQAFSDGTEDVNSSSNKPHTFKDYLNPDNYDSDGHYTGDYRTPVIQTAQAVSDYNSWNRNGGIGLPSIDLRKNGSAIQTVVPAQNIFDVYDSDNPTFWGYKSRPQSDYVAMAMSIPLVRKHLESGMSINDIESMGGIVGACATNYFKNPVNVMKAGQAYIHCNDGRHRTVAAQIAKVEMPVCIVQEYFLNNELSSISQTHGEPKVEHSSFLKAQAMRESDPQSTRTLRMVELSDKNNRRTWRQTEKRSTTQLNDNYYDQIIIGPDLKKSSKKIEGSIIPDHMSGYDSNGGILDLESIDDFSVVSHFDIIEDKNYKIETENGRNNLINNIVKQVNKRNNVLTRNGATVHQTYRIDMSGHGDILTSDMEELYNRLVSCIPENVDIEVMLK